MLANVKDVVSAAAMFTSFSALAGIIAGSLYMVAVSVIGPGFLMLAAYAPVM